MIKLSLIEKTKKAPKNIVVTGGKVAGGLFIGEGIDTFVPQGILGILAKGVIGSYIGSMMDKEIGLGVVGSAGRDVLSLVGIGGTAGGAVGTGASRWL